MSEQPFSVDALREVLDYDPETGWLTWIKPASPRLKSGDRAGSIAKNGRREINVLGRRCFAHHLAWFHHYGEWPTDYVRQRNGDYDDCRIDNLYRQTPEEAGLTKALPSSNTSGFRGVSYESRRNRWQASIRRKYRQLHLGYFDTAEEASAAFQEADKAFRPDVSVEEMDAIAHKLTIQRRRKALWSLTVRGAHGMMGWTDEETFLSDVGDPPAGGYSLRAIDTLRAIGPGNFEWVLPRHAQFDMKTPEGRRAYEQHRRETNPAVFRGSDLRKTFGIDLAEYQAKHDAQAGLCAICGQPETATRNGKVKWLAVDHSHSGDEHIRDLLCAACNMMLGMAQDDPARLRAAALYLERHVESDEEEAA